MIIQHNMIANFTNRQMGINNKSLSKRTEKLSSGYRINRSADDAAGLSISEKMRGQIRGLMQASRNVEDGMNLINVQDAGMQEIHSILDRQRELCVQAANDTYAIEDRQMIQNEINTLTKEIDNIAHGTEFNKIRVLDGEMREVQKEVKKVVGVDVGPVTEETKETLLLDIPRAGFNGAMSGLAAVNKQNSLKTSMLYHEGSADTSGYILSAKDTAGNTYNISNIGTELFGKINGNNTKVTARNSNITDGVKTTYDFYAENGRDILFSVERTITKKKNPTDSSAETYDFSFKVKNKSSTDMTFNIEIGFDIETATIEKGVSLGESNDDPQFLDSSQNLIKQSVKYENSSMPDYIYMFDVNNPYLNIQALYKGNGISNNPSYVKLGQYDNVFDGEIEEGYYSQFEANRPIEHTDTMYSVGWNNILVSANGSSGNYNTMYGVSDPRKNSILKDVLPKKEIITTTETVMQATELNIQCGANTGQLVQLSIYDCKSATLGLENIPVMDSQSATQSISVLDHAQEIIAAYRSHEGAMYNRLSHAYNADLLTAENLQSSESRIRDANLADEMVQFSSVNIIQQAAQSMLAQANSAPEGILSLLG